MNPSDTLKHLSFVVLSRLQREAVDAVRLDVALAMIGAEREECAKIADRLSFGSYKLSDRSIGNAIRARKEPQQ